MIQIDTNRCQAEMPNGQNLMTLGGSHKMIRCENIPTVIVTETKKGDDGLKGSMSLCEECLKIANKQLPSGFFETRSNK